MSDSGPFGFTHRHIQNRGTHRPRRCRACCCRRRAPPGWRRKWSKGDSAPAAATDPECVLATCVARWKTGGHAAAKQASRLSSLLLLEQGKHIPRWMLRLNAPLCLLLLLGASSPSFSSLLCVLRGGCRPRHDGADQRQESAGQPPSGRPAAFASVPVVWSGGQSQCGRAEIEGPAGKSELPHTRIRTRLRDRRGENARGQQQHFFLAGPVRSGQWGSTNATAATDNLSRAGFAAIGACF